MANVIRTVGFSIAGNQSTARTMRASGSNLRDICISTCKRLSDEVSALPVSKDVSSKIRHQLAALLSVGTRLEELSEAGPGRDAERRIRRLGDEVQRIADSILRQLKDAESVGFVASPSMDVSRAEAIYFSLRQFSESVMDLESKPSIEAAENCCIRGRGVAANVWPDWQELRHRHREILEQFQSLLVTAEQRMQLVEPGDESVALTHCIESTRYRGHAIDYVLAGADVELTWDQILDALERQRSI